MTNRIDYAAKDRAKGVQLLTAFIKWTNADGEDFLSLGRTDCCYMRDEIERLRDLERQYMGCNASTSLVLPTVYLCGPINGCNDSEAHDWREDAKAKVGDMFQFLDPMRRDYRGREMEPHIVDEIVDGDKQDLDNSNIILAFCPKPSVGTSMEILYFWERGGRVVIVHPNPNPSPWLVKHSEAIFPDFDSAYAYLIETANGIILRADAVETASTTTDSCTDCASNY